MSGDTEMSDSMPRTALVTGAASGIGKAIADRFERDGWSVLRCDLVAPEGAWSTKVDVRSSADWVAVAEEIRGRAGKLDVLVNNAGILEAAPLAQTSLDMWDRMVAVNLTGGFLGCRTMLPLLQAGTEPAILNLSSIDALRGSLDHAAYAATKGGIVAMSRALAVELAADGIRVNSMCPGTVDTPMAQRVLGSSVADRLALHPLNRISTVEDQAAAAAFLCSAEAGFITGVALSVDGGRAVR
ncbi:SDR family NAD(P)-dependent oxidoreductase [Nocardia callitridis]|uniref:SDR family NAD(P)-dependent oxidoreductase n=1 Tax=Nocardia callitridis TaxID=648753 RepID=A0ABP9KVB4_9NOCA